MPVQSKEGGAVRQRTRNRNRRKQRIQKPLPKLLRQCRGYMYQIRVKQNRRILLIRKEPMSHIRRNHRFRTSSWPAGACSF